MNDYTQIIIMALSICLIPISVYSLVYLADPDKIISRFIKFINRSLAKKEINKGLVIRDTALSRTMISIFFFQVAYVVSFAIKITVHSITSTTTIDDSLKSAVVFIYMITAISLLIYFLVATLKSIFFSLTMIFKKRRNQRIQKQKIQNLKRR